jgi:hypothetical protein
LVSTQIQTKFFEIHIFAIKIIPGKSGMLQPPSAPLWPLPLPQQQQRVLCFPEQQEAGAPSAPKVLRQ